MIQLIRTLWNFRPQATNQVAVGEREIATFILVIIGIVAILLMFALVAKKVPTGV